MPTLVKIRHTPQCSSRTIYKFKDLNISCWKHIFYVGSFAATAHFHYTKMPDHYRTSLSSSADHNHAKVMELSDREKQIIDQQQKSIPSKSGYLAIFRYAAPLDIVFVFISILTCSAAGTALPLMMASRASFPNRPVLLPISC